jgi:CheY-like chemotaxis protein
MATCLTNRATLVFPPPQPVDDACWTTPDRRCKPEHKNGTPGSSDADVQGDPHDARILIVDDEPETTETYARMLRLEGYRVETALDGETGLKIATDRPFDAILVDLRMPRIDGLELLRRLRRAARTERTPVAIVTGYYFLDDQMHAEFDRLGARLWFKPLWTEDLLQLIRTLVESD